MPGVDPDPGGHAAGYAAAQTGLLCSFRCLRPPSRLPALFSPMSFSAGGEVLEPLGLELAAALIQRRLRHLDLPSARLQDQHGGTLSASLSLFKGLF